MSLLGLPSEILLLIVEEAVSSETYYIRPNRLIYQKSNIVNSLQIKQCPPILLACRRTHNLGARAFYLNANFVFEVVQQAHTEADNVVGPLLEYLPQDRLSLLQKVELRCPITTSELRGLEPALAALATATQNVDLTISIFQQQGKSSRHWGEWVFCSMTRYVRYNWITRIGFQFIDANGTRVDTLTMGIDTLTEWVRASIWLDGLEDPNETLESWVGFSKEYFDKLRVEARRLFNQCGDGGWNSRTLAVSKLLRSAMRQILRIWRAAV